MEKDIVNIGKSVVIKGELNGSEDLTIEGHVEGTIQLGTTSSRSARTAASRRPCSRNPSSCSEK
jgi:cytoskeletal protein CcmA (bactofilin family)